MKKLAEKHNGWSKELHYRATWSSEGITSRAALLQKFNGIEISALGNIISFWS